jgi:hypothetical protein
MKVPRLPGIWSLSPIAAVRGLELSCWLAAAGLVLALALAPAPSAGASVRPAAAVVPDNAHLLIAQRRCIDRIIGQAKGQPEDVVVRQVNQQCMAQRPSKPSAAAGAKLLSCEHRIAVRLTPAAKRVAGCLSG